MKLISLKDKPATKANEGKNIYSLNKPDCLIIKLTPNEYFFRFMR